MNREERQKIYRLLSQFYPDAKQLAHPETRTAWGLVLENYTYGDVKARVLEYASRSIYFPKLADITRNLTPEETPTPVEPHTAPPASKYTEEWLSRVDALKQQEAALGGPCQLRKLWDADRSAGENMMEGLFLRRHYPEACAGCRRLAVSGDCSERLMARRIDRERENCLILRGHSGEGRQADVLKKYWRELCPLCSVPPNCFWFAGMKMLKEAHK